jgi:hypothetical protein
MSGRRQRFGFDHCQRCKLSAGLLFSILVVSCSVVSVWYLVRERDLEGVGLTIDRQLECMCTKEYEPYCCNGKTYSNKCLASCVGCSSGNPGACDDCICTQEYEPYYYNGKTYSNKCLASCVGCSSGKPSVCDDCICTEQYDPYCCNGKTYSNKCHASCAGCSSGTPGLC